jgi:hypothetical protein
MLSCDFLPQILDVSPAPFIVRRAVRRLDFEQGRPLSRRGGLSRSRACQNQLDGATPEAAEKADLGKYLGQVLSKS